jgi:hypothetical protein
VISDFGRLVVLALVLEQLDLGEIAAAYASDRGQPPFDPAMMTALLLDGCCSGVYSSRGCARTGRLHERRRARSGGFRTVSDFRKRDVRPKWNSSPMSKRASAAMRTGRPSFTW